jgi:hypothetical protein
MRPLLILETVLLQMYVDYVVPRYVGLDSVILLIL